MEILSHRFPRHLHHFSGLTNGDLDQILHKLYQARANRALMNLTALV